MYVRTHLPVGGTATLVASVPVQARSAVLTRVTGAVVDLKLLLNLLYGLLQVRHLHVIGRGVLATFTNVRVVRTYIVRVHLILNEFQT